MYNQAGSCWSAQSKDRAPSGFDFHRHPVAQVTVGLDGPLTVVLGGGRTATSPVVVIAGGASHALRSAGARFVLSVYLSPVSRAGAALNALSGGPGVWTVDDEVAQRISSIASQSGGMQSAADSVVREVLQAGGLDLAEVASAHVAVRSALRVLTDSIPDRVGLAAVARAVAVSPDYLGRLFRRQTGTSFAATSRWLRLLNALHHLDRGASITDAAHLAGFADSAHAHRVCRELAGLPPNQVALALAADRTDLFKRS
ncbi:helix-turn-helix domain-containing protein [Mycobacterium intracellulare]|uniref:AraC family transcriptional regulator n=1 Tax=Mycobacterium intracellulare TaxID=1767 RepID=UPI001CDA148E|nr:helix-turn-helix transcriptional regulator [Mycobacterium intracellulare]MCA2250808.1 helix-turn-helix domain-containing protein [Mycobacterium intracellulare]